jgi:multiple antibiotic resistance protein
VQDFTQSLITIFVLLNPIGVIPFFQGLTAGATPKQRGAIAKRAIIIAVVVLLVFAYVGDIILAALQITTEYVMIAGGVFIIVFAVRDVVSSESQAVAQSLGGKTGTAKKDVDEGVAVFPLAIPLLAGPGAIAAVMILNSPDYGALKGWLDFSEALAIVVDCVIVWALFSLSSRLTRILRPSVMVITGKVMDILMGAIGISFLVRGALAIFGVALT